MHVLWHLHGIYRYIGQNLGYEKQTNYMEIITQMYNVTICKTMCHPPPQLEVVIDFGSIKMLMHKKRSVDLGLQFISILHIYN
jgi:hypothetical protein